MNRINGAIVVLAIVSSLAYFGCAKDSVVGTTSSDQQYFTTVVNGNESQTSDLATSDQTALDDGAMYNIAQAPAPPAIQSIADDHDMHPLKWGRYINGAQRVITKIDLEGDSVAVVHVQVTYTGTYIVYGMVNNAPDTVKKPYTEVLHRLFRFVRIANKEEKELNWKLDAVSILNGGTVPTSINITQMQLISPLDTMTATDPDAYFMHISKGWLHGLPLWGFHVQVTVNVTVHSSDPDTDVVTIHYVPKSFGLHRVPMMLVSQTGDSTAGYTRVYTQTFAVPGNDKKLSQLVVSATTHGSITSVSSTAFSSSVWGLPYKTSE